MTSSLERTVTVAKPLSAVWAYLTDFENTNAWDEGTVTTSRRSGDGGVGTVYDNTSEFRGKETELVYTVLEVVPQSRFVIQGVNKTVTSTDTMTFTGDESSTTVVYRADFEFHGLAKLAVPFLGKPMATLGDGAERGMRRELEKL